MPTPDEVKARIAELEAQLAGHGIEKPDAPPKDATAKVRCDNCAQVGVVPASWVTLMCNASDRCRDACAQGVKHKPHRTETPQEHAILLDDGSIVPVLFAPESA